MQSGLYSAYVIDYDMLYAYMYELATRPELAVELDYLFSQKSIRFVLGRGTLEELRRGFELSAKGKIETRSISEEEVQRWLPALPKVDQGAYVRLVELMSNASFHTIEGVEKEIGHALDQSPDYSLVLEQVMGAMDMLRWLPPPAARNVADALNVTDVLMLRSLAERGVGHLFPFLLTHTRALQDQLQEHLSEKRMPIEFSSDVPISRRPAVAMYSSLVSEAFPDSGEAADHTAELDLRASMVELKLRLSKGYKDSTYRPARSDWTSLVVREGSSSAKQLSELSLFIEDPVVSEAQRLYDNTLSAIGNWVRAGESAEVQQSPRKLFDVIVSLARGVRASRATLLRTWRTAIDIDVSEETKTFSFRRYYPRELHTKPDPEILRRPNRFPYMETERHDEGYSVVRWPASPKAGRLLAAFMYALARHDVKECILYVGCGSTTLSYEVSVPFTLTELREQVAAQVSEPIHWLRIAAEGFDLYADLITRPDFTPMVAAIFVRDKLESVATLEHLSDLYGESANRFVFEPWFDAMIRDSGVIA